MAVRVLIADGDAASRDGLRALLQGAGLEVAAAGNGLEAFDLIRSQPPALIIADVPMPEMDGFTLCRLVKSITALRAIPFIFYTASYVEPEDEALGLWLGAARYLRRSDCPGTLLDQIDAVIGAPEAAGQASASLTGTEGAERQFEAAYRQRLVEKLEDKSRDLDQLRREHALILDSAGEGILSLDLDGSHRLVNPTAARLLGYRAEEMLGRTDHRLWHRLCADSDAPVRDQCAILACMRDGKLRTRTEDLFQRKDGSAFPVAYTVAPLTRSGKIEGAVVVFRDISERKQAEERLRLAASVFENTAEGVVITDPRGRVVEINRAFTDILGYRRDEVIGRNPRMWRSQRHDEQFYRGLWRALLETGQWRGEIWNRRKDGSVFPEWLTISSVLDAGGRLSHYVGVFSDISKIKQSEAQLDHLAHHDALTDLPNRLLLNERLAQAIRHARRQGTQLALIFLDLDQFKHINDSLGHPVGDLLLQGAAGRLLGCVREDDTVARIGGDEFVIMLEGIERAEHAALAAQKIIAALSGTFQLDRHAIGISASLGICLFPDDGEDAETLLRNADAAMYKAKAEGRNTYRFYTEQLTRNALERVTMENALRRALEQGELVLHYQTQVDIASGRFLGVEALIRWPHPEQGFIPPERFIPLAEDCGLIFPIGEWVLRTACTQAREWLDRGLEIGRIAVNLSGCQVRPGLSQRVAEILAETGLPAERLELEVTESSLMRQETAAFDELESLCRIGVALAMDDFGTGYSSLSYLKRLPIQKIKLDSSFVRDLPNDAEDIAIAKAVVALGSSLERAVIAEGVETREQADFLLAAGCREGQGFFYSRPVTAAALEPLLQAPVGGDPARDA
jgi:diguanylate cyclase (GGDEF)-like protein/PAS domain S-box-containing protein